MFRISAVTRLPLLMVFMALSGARAEQEGAPAPKEGPELHPVMGPQKIDVGKELVLDLPAGFLYLDAPQAQKYMESLGNVHNDALLGLISKPEESWLVTVTFVEDGYVKDDEAEKMDADAILDSIREGTEEANKVRQERGFKALHVVGWSEPPRYERQAHHLVWGIRGRDDDGEVINFNTRVLGRKGFASLNLIDAPQHIEASKPEVATLLVATAFKAGARYEDFDAKSDKVAEYGLAALVAGGAGAAALKLVKVGLLAKLGGKLLALLFAFKKAIVLLFLAGAVGIKRLLGMKKAQRADGAGVATAKIGRLPDSSVPEEHSGTGGAGGQKSA